MSEARILKTIQNFKGKHSYSNEWKSPTDCSNSEKEDAIQDAIDWWGTWTPEWAELIAEINDGDSHDVSTVRYWRVKTSIGQIGIYSYNNNAWGHCDVLVGDEDPGSIKDWLINWDELPEDWLKEYAGIETDEDAE